MGDNADPRKSSLGKLWSGDTGGFGSDVASGFGQVVDKGQKVNEFMLNPVGTVAKGYGDATGGGNVSTDPSDEFYAGQAAESQAAQAEAAQRARDKQNQDYLKSQQTVASGIADEDAFMQARNAARRAKGNKLFGAFNG